MKKISIIVLLGLMVANIASAKVVSDIDLRNPRQAVQIAATSTIKVYKVSDTIGQATSVTCYISVLETGGTIINQSISCIK